MRPPFTRVLAKSSHMTSYDFNMKPLAELSERVARRAMAVLTDIDDTLTEAAAFRRGLSRLWSGCATRACSSIPVTGRPAGWCDLIARQWPVDAVVGENGAFWFRYDDASKRMVRRFMRPDEEWQSGPQAA